LIFEKDEGVFYWVYEMSLWKNPTIIITLLKVLSIALILPTLVVFLSTLFDLGFIEALYATVQLTAIGIVILFVLMALVYIILAFIYGGKYCVVFEMDKKFSIPMKCVTSSPNQTNPTVVGNQIFYGGSNRSDSVPKTLRVTIWFTDN